MTLEEVLEPARKAAQVVLDREWYTPGTARALALGGRLGAAPFLALVSDEEAAMITGRAIIDRRADRVSDEMATSSISDNIAEEAASWFGESADGFGTAPQWWEEMSIKKPPATAAAAVTEEAEAEAEAEAAFDAEFLRMEAAELAKEQAEEEQRAADDRRRGVSRAGGTRNEARTRLYGDKQSRPGSGGDARGGRKPLQLSPLANQRGDRGRGGDERGDERGGTTRRA